MEKKTSPQKRPAGKAIKGKKNKRGGVYEKWGEGVADDCTLNCAMAETPRTV